MRIKELKETIEEMRQTHEFTDDAMIKVSPSPSGRTLVEIGVFEDGTQIILSREVEEGRYNPVTGEEE